MRLDRQFLEALQSLRSNLLRSALTILGIVIGVAAVISMVSIGQGAQASINSSIESIGSNLIFVTSGAQNVKNARPLTLADATAIGNRSEAPDVLAVAPILQGRLTLVNLKQSTTIQVLGVTANYASIRSLQVSDGEFITDASARSQVIVLGSTVATDLFGDTSGVVGQTVKINGQPFRVVGVLVSKGGNGFGSQDDQAYIPIATAQSRFFRRQSSDTLDTVYVQAASATSVQAATDEITTILNSRHRITSDKLSDFTLTKQSDILASASSITGTLTIFLGGIGAISLLVGGIGIMNIMLVTVTERTKEIGLRKALGARNWDIRLQFLIESALLSLIGGILGILVSEGVSSLIGSFAASSGTNLTPLITIDVVLIATVFSAVIGVFFGIYPANRAANLEPVEALRTE